ncbi:DNA-methyltransferase [Micavibrio aeruginosavorus]|uniref:Methyltransferase n=1 Tax=Micavibrio aeruginosavorus (strain ARL-13) TaxID=856793 RepID=G2KMX4_MICAA|nr:site-specific DNA-methyltransferase [Micavibrio aeruginosavorus]AEP08906.1 DNA methylase family protein [Micavibrio aeruginosavorus ARL-13]
MTVQILHGDVIDRLKSLPDESVDIVVTSPPYWGLRDYGVEGQLGMEMTLSEHIQNIVAVFAEIHRVLKKTGTVWLNYGDCYASTPNGRPAKDIQNDDRAFRDKPFSTIQGKLKAKDLCMLPNRLAIALQEWEPEGSKARWWVRSEIVWAKPNAMPDSAKDRPAVAHEKIFLLTKSRKYFYNHQDVRVQQKTSGDYYAPSSWGDEGSHGKFNKDGRTPHKTRGRDTYGRHTLGENLPEKQRGHSRRHAGFNDRWDHMSKAEQQSNGRALRNYEPAYMQVWEIPTHAFSGAHFATFPPELVRRCLLAGCPSGGVVLDPFGGSGTTGLVAESMGLDSILIELNADYIDIARDRLRAGLVSVKADTPEKSKDAGPLFAGAVA